jgi:ferritin-like metal-binding protein YciE
LACWHFACEQSAIRPDQAAQPQITMKASTEEIADWLRDAHAMESNLANMLEGQVPRLADYPELQRGVATHAEQSKRHAALVEGALESLGENTSALKEGIARLAGKISPLGVGMASDAPVKVVLSNYAAEHFEIACYLSLRTACEDAGLSEIAAMCEDILADEEEMAETLLSSIGEMTLAHLSMAASQ